MKIEVSGANRYEFCDELLSVMVRRNVLLKKPQTKIKGYVAQLKANVWLAIGGIILMIVCLQVLKDSIFLFMAILMAMLLAYTCFSIHTGNKSIRQIQETDGLRTIDVNEEGVRFTDQRKDILISWDCIKWVIASKETVCFVPDKIDSMIVALDIERKDEVKRALEENGKADLFVDNTGLYIKK